ncbi:DHA3 family macrolide efflux protein-like MFS transporter [Clostridium pascui]|uniref:MFS transporter n=1 Tax=Clostridium pascui TaxID=46609 RepID=UPI001958D201|nr:MFS transporter [Clostridium pascui]MBM7871312.1 DHA3 family macrolide efflux protein-like MFS transporter [Clostridium pascui]
MNNNWKRNITLFLASQTISLFGSMLVQYAITWYITLQTQSGVMMAISIICGFVPTFFLSPFAGVWADRYNRKVLIMLSDSLIAISTLILAILFLKGYDSLWMLFVASAVRSVGSGVQTPAISAFLPQLVPEDKLTKVNATNSSIQSLVMLVSPMISGALLNMATIESIFFIDVITAAIAVSILLLFLKVPSHAKALEKQKTSYFSDMVEGYNYIKNHGYVKRFFVFCAIFYALVSPAAFLTPLQVARSFGDDVWRLTAVEITFSVGMMLGGIIIASWGGFKNRTHTMTLSSLIMGICTFALGVVPNFWVYLSFMCLFGAVMPAFNTPATVLLQEKVEENFLGRVFSVLGMISSITMPLAMLVFGPLADAVAIEWMLIGTGVLLVVQGFFLMKNKELIEAGMPVSKPEL